MIGITGGVASGKSVVSERMQALGALLLDADRFSRETVEPQEPAWQLVKEAFPSVIRGDSRIDRKKLGQIVFADPEARKVLEKIIHPFVLKRLLSEAAEGKLSGRVVVAEVPLLYEVGWEHFMDKVWVVTVKPEIQLERLIKRANISKEQAEQMIASQLPLEEKVARADIVIENSGSLEETFRQVDTLWKELQRENSPNRP